MLLSFLTYDTFTNVLKGSVFAAQIQKYITQKSAEDKFIIKPNKNGRALCRGASQNCGVMDSIVTS